MPRECSAAFAPGRVNLIGEHTDYNEGLALPFAIAEGITVRAEEMPAAAPGEERVRVYARDLDERDEFSLADPAREPAPARTPAPAREPGWRAFARGTVFELTSAGFPLVGASVEISGDLPPGGGLSSSAALEVALCLTLIDLGARAWPAAAKVVRRRDLARLCSRVENDWVGAQTGLLDQLASLYGEPEAALCIDFHTLRVDPVPLRLEGWRLVLVDSGERHVHASSGYNERRAECADACRLLGLPSLRRASGDALAKLPEPLRRRARHVLDENERVRLAVAALQADDLAAIGGLLNASHRSLRDNYEVSTAAVESAVESLQRAGASGARLVGGGFGGNVLGLFAPGVLPPAGTHEVRPAAGAHLIER